MNTQSTTQPVQEYTDFFPNKVTPEMAARVEAFEAAWKAHQQKVVPAVESK